MQRLSQQAATANYKGDKLAVQAKSHEDLGECPRCGHAVSKSAFKNNKCNKKSKFVECCNSRVHKVPTQTKHFAPRRDDALVYRDDCCGPWPGHVMAEGEVDPNLVVAKVDRVGPRGTRRVNAARIYARTRRV